MLDYITNSGAWIHIRRAIIVLVIILITSITAKIASKIIEKSLQKTSKKLKVKPNNYKFLRHLITGIIYVSGVIFALGTIPALRTLSVSLFAGAGVLAIIIGFASQQAFANIVSGIFIVIFKPFRIGDRIKINIDVSGVVEDINLRHTVIRNFENKRIVIPNTIISNEMIENSNLADEKICRFIDFGISYDSDISKAIKIIQREAMKHPFFNDNRTKEEKEAGDSPVNVRVIGFGDSSVNLRGYVWASNPINAFRMGTDLNKSIKESFDKEGIEIPFPYRTIVYKKDIEKESKTQKNRAKKK